MIGKIRLDVGGLDYTIPVCLKYIGSKFSEDPLLIYKDDSGLYLINLNHKRSVKIIIEQPSPDLGLPESVNVHLTESYLQLLSTTYKAYEFK